jgi:hypothetical protein
MFLAQTDIVSLNQFLLDMGIGLVVFGTDCNISNHFILFTVQSNFCILRMTKVNGENIQTGI